MIRSLVKSTVNLLLIMPKAERAFYAIKRGRVPGVYSTWSQCEKQVKGFSNPLFRKFSTHKEALEFMTEAVTSAPQSTSEQISNDVTVVIQHNSSDTPKKVKSSPPVMPSIYTTPTTNVTKDASSTISICCHCNTGAVNIVSLSSTVENMKASIENIMGVVENLSGKLEAVRSSVSRLEKSLFVAPGSKRSYSTNTLNADGDDQTKRPKLDCNADCFTGRQFDEREGVHVYTDGGCFDNGRNGARAGIGVFWGNNDPDNTSERLAGRPTNNRAEIHAAVCAVQIAKRRGIMNLILHTDSQFLINGITMWIRSWKKNQWKNSTGSQVINQADFEELDRELQGINVKWVYVRGHNGDPSNEEADRLAKQGAEKPELIKP